METEKKEVVKDPKARSRSYPRYNLEEAIKFVEIVSKLGRKNISEKSIAAENGKSITNSGFIGRMSSAKQFGLISKDEGKLSLTQLGNEIMFPPDDISKVRAIKKAFTMPTLYKELLDAFGGTKIPEYSSLGNRLVNDYGIETGARGLASKNFIKSAEYAEVIQNGILVVDAELTMPDSNSKDMADTFNNNINKNANQNIRQPAIQSDNMVFEFFGGVKLVIPRSKKASDDVMDGELKIIKIGLNEFSEKFCKKEGLSEETNGDKE